MRLHVEVVELGEQLVERLLGEVLDAAYGPFSGCSAAPLHPTTPAGGGLDYVLYSTRHLEPRRTRSEASGEIAPTASSRVVCPRSDDLDLSDHYAVLGSFVFPASPATADGAGGLEVMLCGDEYEWIEDDFEAGDVLAFGSHTVHKSLPLQMPDRIRMSCDYRYQPASEDIEANSLRVHCDVLEWDEAYEGWSNEALKYYWKERTLKLSPWDESIRWQKEKIC